MPEDEWVISRRDVFFIDIGLPTAQFIKLVKDIMGLELD
jgi:hypothetical protein